MADKVARTARLELSYRGVDLAEHCVRAEYIDHAQGAQDELTATLEDRDQRWQGSWMPAKGDQVAAAILCRDWLAPGDSWRLDCGAFEIGEITLNGPPDMVEIRATSTRVSANARNQKKTKPWEDVSLMHIAGAVAERAGLALHWEANDRHYERVDQREEADLAFLRRLALDAGNSVKPVDEKLIVYAGRDWDARPASASLTRGQDGIRTYRFRSATHDLYRGCVCTYWHPDLKEYLVGEFMPPGAPPTGELLRVNQPVKDLAEAQELARNTLRKKNRVEVNCDLELMGDPRRRATQVLALSGWGHFDGHYFVDQCRHSLDGQGGMVTNLDLRKVLDY